MQSQVKDAKNTTPPLSPFFFWRPTDVPDTGLICDLLWADPDKDSCGAVDLDTLLESAVLSSG